jgi:hypothetical protein
MDVHDWLISGEEAFMSYFKECPIDYPIILMRWGKEDQEKSQKNIRDRFSNWISPACNTL